MDCIVPGVAKSQTRLSDFHCFQCKPALASYMPVPLGTFMPLLQGWWETEMRGGDEARGALALERQPPLLQSLGKEWVGSRSSKPFCSQLLPCSHLSGRTVTTSPGDILRLGGQEAGRGHSLPTLMDPLVLQGAQHCPQLTVPTVGLRQGPKSPGWQMGKMVEGAELWMRPHRTRPSSREERETGPTIPHRAGSMELAWPPRHP